MRGAVEAGAGNVPDAMLHLKLAQEERGQALLLIQDGSYHRASLMLARSEADSELAIALAHAAVAQVAASTAQDSVDTLQERQTP